MFPLLETIKIQNYRILNPEYHNNRINHSLKTLFNITTDIKIETVIELNESFDKNTTYKCRFLYNTHSYKYEFIKYQQPVIKSLRLITDESADYALKKTDRSYLDHLRAQKEKYDDILIVKNNRITDTSFANIIFWIDNKWITPVYPLLKGTKRQYYIDKNIIFEKDIQVSDIHNFSKARIINAMIDIDESMDIDIKNISF